jgi:aminoglycoside phosphotransferase (APT) family kinase protein
VLRGELATLLEPDATLGRCSLTRAKLKPERKLTGYYSVEVVRAGRREVRAAEVVWNAAEPRSDYAADAEAAMEAEACAAGVAAPFRSLRADVPRLRLHIRVAPLDVTYPHLVRLSRPDHVRDLLTQAYAVDGEAGKATPEYVVTTLRYRPRQRHVLRYDPADGVGAGPVFAKLYRHGTVARAMRIAATVADLVAAADADTTTARPLGGTAAADVMLYPLVPGVPLTRRLRERGAPPVRQLTAAGSLLRALHQHPGGLVGDLDQHDLGAELASVARAAEHLGPLLPSAAARVDRLLELAAELGAATATGSRCFAHGDYKADHVWVARDRLTLLDFDTCCMAEPALDLGKFLADLTWWYVTSGGPGLVAAQQLFLGGYGDAPPGQLSRARLYEAVVLLKLAIRRLRRFEPEWSQRTAALVDHAGRLLEAVAAGQTDSPSGSLAR